MGCGIYDVGVRFLTTNVDGLPINMCLTVGALSEDWYGECEFCPENDAEIQKLEIFFNNHIEKIPVNKLKGFVFEDMMGIIEEVWP